MSTITISLPSQIAKRVDSEAKKQGFATRSEFIRSLLRRYFTGKANEGLVFHEFQAEPLSEIRTAFERTGKYNKKFIDSLIVDFQNHPHMPIKPLSDKHKLFIKRRGLIKKFNKQIKIFQKNPRHPSLHTELLEPKSKGVYSFRIDRK